MEVWYKIVRSIHQQAVGIAGGIESTFGRILGTFKRRVAIDSMSRQIAGKHNTPERKERLRHDILKLEKKLDGLYQDIAHGAESIEDTDLFTADLRTKIKSIRETKNKLRKQRAELSKIKRQEFREDRFIRTVSYERRMEWSAKRWVNGQSNKETKSEEKLLALAKEMFNREEIVSSLDDAQRLLLNKAIADVFDPNPVFRRDAAVRLGELGITETEKLLFRLVKDRNNKVSAAAINSMALFRDESVAPLFRWHAESEDVDIRLASLRGLAMLGIPEDSFLFFSCMEDNRSSIRRSAATYLGWRKEKAAVPVLMRSLRDEEEEVRAAAIDALGNICDELAVLALIRMLRDPSMKIRDKAKSAIEKTIGRVIDLDILADKQELEMYIEQMKEWWKAARVDRNLDNQISPQVFKKREHHERDAFLPEEEINEEVAAVDELDVFGANVTDREGLPADLEQSNELDGLVVGVVSGNEQENLDLNVDGLSGLEELDVRIPAVEDAEQSALQDGLFSNAKPTEDEKNEITDN